MTMMIGWNQIKKHQTLVDAEPKADGVMVVMMMMMMMMYYASPYCMK